MTTQRGLHKIIIGAAPGVGKTYRMLLEAQALLRQGLDVVVGYFEPHGRADTIGLLQNLELIPRKQIPYKSILLEEMDVEAIIKRNPHTVLVDELAHTNVQGSKNSKRYQDVEALLKAGINVISTLNIQHIESLNDIVSRITNIRVNERVPDALLTNADEVVLVDISVEELQKRLKEGKIYAPEKIEQSLSNFFKKGNLVALRELALREVADSVEEQAQVDIIACPAENTGIHERIMVCISTHPNSQRLIRRGYRIASRLNGELYVVYARPKNKTLPAEYLKTLEQHKHLTQSLKGQFVEIESTSILDTLIEQTQIRKITQIIVGESLKVPGLFSFLKPALPYQIFQKTNNIDVFIIASGRDLI